MRYVMCEQKRKDCYGCDRQGRCVVLRDTHFADEDGVKYNCPFFKTPQEAGTCAEKIKREDALR